MESNQMTQTELDIPVELEPPYNGLYWCAFRRDLFRWPEYIGFYKRTRL